MVFEDIKDRITEEGSSCVLCLCDSCSCINNDNESCPENDPCGVCENTITTFCFAYSFNYST